MVTKTWKRNTPRKQTEMSTCWKRKVTPMPSHPQPRVQPRPSRPPQYPQRKTTSKPQQARWKGVCDESAVTSSPPTALSHDLDKVWTRTVGMESRMDDDRQMSTTDSYLT